MSACHTAPNGQLGFDALLSETDKQNANQKLDRRTAHLPNTMEDAVGFLQTLIARHHEAMLAAEIATVMALRKEAALLALHLNHGEPGIIADENAPGSVLSARTAAQDGTIPLWGQRGVFTVTACGMQVRVEIDGMFGIGATSMYWPGFSAYALDRDKPFLSETGYRSFLGIAADAVPGFTPERFCISVIERHVERELKGRLLKIAPRWQPSCG